MRITIYSFIFILLLMGADASQDSSSAAAQDAPATSTIPATATIPATSTIQATSTPAPCLPIVEPGPYAELITWDPPNGNEFEPGDLVTFRLNDSSFRAEAWVLNGSIIYVPTPTPMPTATTGPTATPRPMQIQPTATQGPYPAPNSTPTATLVPTQVPIDPYPAPVQGAAAYANCIVPTSNCISATMPNSCQLVVEVIGWRSPTENIPTSDTPWPEDLFQDPTATPQPAQPPEPQSIPEPITIILFGVGATGLAGYAKWRRRIE